MINYNDEVSFYVDTLIIETFMSDNGNIVKTAQSEGILQSLITKVQQYVSNQIDPNNTVKSVLNILAPGAISVLFGAIGFGWLGTLLGLAMNIFHIDTTGILESIYEKIKSILTSDNTISSNKIDEIVHSSISENSMPATPEEADLAEKQLQRKSSFNDLKDAKLLKIAMIEYDNIILNNLKFAASSGFFSIFSDKKGKTINLLAKVLGWIFKVVIGSAGLLAAGDIVNKFLNRPNAIDSTYQRGRTETTETSTPSLPSVTSTQTKFPLNPSYHDQILNSNSLVWIINIPNNQANIEQEIMDFTKEVYQGLEGQDSAILNSNKFQNVVDTIVWYNRSSAGGPMVFIPKMFTSKKNLVDHFIDEVAQKAS